MSANGNSTSNGNGGAGPLPPGGGGLGRGGAPGSGAGDDKGGTIFNQPPPEGHAKKVSEVLGEIVWLMSQSPLHKQFFIQDLEWFVMTPVLLQQFRLFYDKEKPIGLVLWATVSEEVEQNLARGTTKLRPQDWKSGETSSSSGAVGQQGRLWVVEVIAPFGGAEEMVKDLKANVFPSREVRFLALRRDGRKEVSVA